MRKTILMMLLAGVSSSATAEWIAVGSLETTTVYADPATLRKEGDRVKIWVLFDLKTASAPAGVKPFMSSRAQYEYDCKEKRLRGLYYTLHAGGMAGGEVVGQRFGPSDWTPAAPDSLNETLWKIACGK